jgi:hypothetical protein
VSGYGLVLVHERADRGQGPAGAAREAGGQRVGGDPEDGDERHPDDRADAALQDAEPVPGLGWLGQPVADHRQDRDLHALLAEQPEGAHGPARCGHCAVRHQQDRAARRLQHAAARAGPSHHAQVPGRTQQPGQGGHAGAAMRTNHHDLARWRMPRLGGRRARTVPGTGRHRVHAVSFAA